MNSIINISQEALLKIAEEYADLKKPFVIYNKPNSNLLLGIFQKDIELYFVTDYNEKGFVFAPFDGEERVFLPLDKSEIISAIITSEATKTTSNLSNYFIDKEGKIQFVNLVEKGIREIKSTDLKKVVLSRIETLSIENAAPIALFKKLLNRNTTSFTYCFYHPKVGTWLGAFSEQLVRVKGVNFETMAVAGTQLYEEQKEIIWKNKEIEEQKIVTDFIVSNIQNKVSNLLISKPYSFISGNVAHIKTEISGELNTSSNIEELLSVLHPTPAVCGFPKQKSKFFIAENEADSREYYAGFLGELNTNFDGTEKTTELFVNLRCMQLKENTALLYMGCGITKDSIPEKEWQETVNKSNTIKQILDLKL